MIGYTIEERPVIITLSQCDIILLSAAVNFNLQYYGLGEGLDKYIAEALLKRLEEVKGKVKPQKRTEICFSESQARIMKESVKAFDQLQRMWMSGFSKWQQISY